MVGSVWIAGEPLTPGLNWEQQEEGIDGLAGPASEEQGIWGVQVLWILYFRKVKVRVTFEIHFFHR